MSSSTEQASPANSAAHIRQIGLHRVLVEGPIIVFWFVGDFTLDHWPGFVALVDDVIATHGYAYIIGHLKEAGTVGLQVRKVAAPWLAQTKLRGFANVQASVLARGLAIMLANGIRLLTGFALPFGFFESESKARAWIHAQEQLRTKAVGIS